MKTFVIIKNNWIQHLALLFLVVMLILAEIMMSARPDLKPPLTSVSVPAQGHWISSRREQLADWVLMRYDFVVDGQRWIYLFPQQPIEEPVELYLQPAGLSEFKQEDAQDLGRFDSDGQRVIVDSSSDEALPVLVGVSAEDSHPLFRLALD